MNPRIPYNPDKRRTGAGNEGGGCVVRLFWLLVPVLALAIIWAVHTYGLGGAIAALGATAANLCQPRPRRRQPARRPPARPWPRRPTRPQPTRPCPPARCCRRRRRRPRPLPAAAATQFYMTQSGDTIPALAARFGVNPANIKAPSGLKGTTTLASGQLLVIPHVLGEVGPDYKLIPDSELVYSGAAAGFDPQAFAAQKGGYLATYSGAASGHTALGGAVILSAALDHSVNPRLLTAVLEADQRLGDQPAAPRRRAQDIHTAMSTPTWLI